MSSSRCSLPGTGSTISWRCRIRLNSPGVAQALKDRHDRLAPASVIEGELVVTCPQQTAAEAPGETTTDSTVEAAAEAIGVESPKVAAEITSFAWSRLRPLAARTTEF
jgi:hypothetical protein